MTFFGASPGAGADPGAGAGRRPRPDRSPAQPPRPAHRGRVGELHLLRHAVLHGEILELQVGDELPFLVLHHHVDVDQPRLERDGIVALASAAGACWDRTGVADRQRATMTSQRRAEPVRRALGTNLGRDIFS